MERNCECCLHKQYDAIGWPKDIACKNACGEEECFKISFGAKRFALLQLLELAGENKPRSTPMNIGTAVIPTIELVPDVNGSLAREIMTDEGIDTDIQNDVLLELKHLNALLLKHRGKDHSMSVAEIRKIKEG